MNKVTQVLGTLILGAAVATTSSAFADPALQSSAAAKISPKKDIPGNVITVDTSVNDNAIHGEVGDILFDGTYYYERLPDNTQIVPEGPSPMASTEGFVVSNFAGNTSLDKSIVLSSTYVYWKIWIKNTGSSAITVSIAGDKNGPHSIPGGETWNIWSDKAWSTGTYKVGFTNGSGMQGQAAARIGESIADLSI
ncbi:hypothetical protein [Paenibacillus pabuli]|uniref:hypothetical protein n=1 Tax=Paenibacillus pabuli TaxID=1472 RepID=UPI003CE91C09